MTSLRRSLALAALVLLVTGAAAARGAPVQVQVRVEGKGETLFEGPVVTEGHGLKASSESAEHPCDGLNNSANTAPGATPTAATADAMTTISESFDARWYPGYEDFLITRWGPQREAEGESWELYANNTPLSVGGCQFELHAGAQVLWSFGIASAKPLLALFPGGTSDGAPALTATAKLNVPFAVEVLAYKSKSTSQPPSLPGRTGSYPYSGAEVAPVETASNGSEKPLPESPQTVKTEDGKAAITFTTSGWHRIKALAPGTIRSNRLDVCVPPEGSQNCGAPPHEDELPPSTGQDSAGETLAPTSGAPQEGTHTGAGGAQTMEPSGSTTNTLRLDGLTLSPLGTHSPELHFGGPWHRLAEASAWRGSVMLGRAGARLAVALASGRPAFVLRDVRAGTRVEIRSDGHSRRYRLAGSGRGYLLLRGSLRAHRGTVSLRVISGTVGVDGVAVTS